MSLEKLALMNIAAALTQAAVQGDSKLAAIDPTIQDPTIRAKNLETWEVFRIMYTAVSGALTDATNWPEPQLASSSVVPSIIQQVITAVTPLASSNPLLSVGLQVLQTVLAKLTAAPTPTPTPATPLPNPGQTAVPTATAAGS